MGYLRTHGPASRSRVRRLRRVRAGRTGGQPHLSRALRAPAPGPGVGRHRGERRRSEEHTSELQSRENLVCRLLLEKKKIKNKQLTTKRRKERKYRENNIEPR